jgi:hypothetical protein
MTGLGLRIAGLPFLNHGEGQPCDRHSLFHGLPAGPGRPRARSGGSRVLPAGPDWAANIRLPLLPQSLVPALQEHQLAGRSLHRRALATGWGLLLLPYALARKAPNADREWAWPGVFPQQNRWSDRESGTQGRLFLLSLATQLLERGQDIRTIQELCGYKEVGTTMVYTPELNRGPLGVRSPADILVPGEQLVLGPVNQRYLRRAFGKTCRGTGNLRGWPTGCINGSRKSPAGRPWFSEPSNKELGGSQRQFPAQVSKTFSMLLADPFPMDIWAPRKIGIMPPTCGHEKSRHGGGREDKRLAVRE